MANVPIVTELTFAELEALVAAEGLNEGLQYKVTDKNWLLVATGNNTLSSIIEPITVLNGDIIPDYITSNYLAVIFEVDTDISITPYNVYMPRDTNYGENINCIPSHIYVKGIDTNDYFSNLRSFAPLFTFGNIEAKTLHCLQILDGAEVQSGIYLLADGCGNGNSFLGKIIYMTSLL